MGIKFPIFKDPHGKHLLPVLYSLKPKLIMNAPDVQKLPGPITGSERIRPWMW